MSEAGANDNSNNHNLRTMTKFYLTKCIPYQGNREINEFVGNSLKEAIEFFNSHNAVQLNADGYQKKNNITYTVTEAFSVAYL